MKEITRPTIPLPSEVPNPVDLSLFPEKAVESLAVLTLQHQQKELLTRLKITLRRLEHLEKQNQHLLRERHQWEKSLYAMRDQIYLYQEKDRLYKKEQEKQKKHVQELQQNLISAEKEYLDLHAQNQEMLHRCQGYEKKITNYRRYRHRIEIKVRPLINRLKSKLKV